MRTTSYQFQFFVQKKKSMCQKGNVIVLILSEVIKLFEKKHKLVAIVAAFAKRTFANQKRKNEQNA